MTITRLQAAVISALRTFLWAFTGALLTIVQGAQNVADVASVAWWKAAIVAAFSAGIAAIGRYVWPQPTDRPNVFVDSVRPKEVQ